MSKDGPNMSGKGERFEKKGESVEKNEGKYEEYEVSEEEKIISEKIRRLARRERITVTDPEAYQKALTAIRKIEEVFSSRRFEEARPEFSYSYDRLFGTMLGFEVIITEYGVIMGSDKLREIARDPRNSDFVLHNGTHTMFKRDGFEKYVAGLSHI